MEPRDDGSTPPVHLPEFGLYYPFINVRDERWLKLAALYWPKLAHMVPAGYPPRETELTRTLVGELGFLFPVEPESARQDAATSFDLLLTERTEDQQARWRMADVAARHAAPGPDELQAPVELTGEDTVGHRAVPISGYHQSGHIDGALDERWPLAVVHPKELAPDLLRRLLREELAIPMVGNWIGMHAELAWLYKCHLADVLAARNRLVPVTDQLAAHATMPGLARPDGQSGVDVTARFGLLAISAVVPRNLDAVPVKKIVQARRTLGGEFDRWRQHVDAIGRTLAEQLRDVESPAVAQEYLNEAVRRYATQPVDDLRKGLTGIGLDAALTASSVKFTVPGGVAAAAAPVAAAPGIVAALVGLRRSTQVKAQAKMAAPAAYLLGLSETLADRGFLARLVSAVRRGAGLRG